MSSARSRRRRAWRARLRALAAIERREARTRRAIAVERERGRRGDGDALRVAAAIEMLSTPARYNVPRAPYPRVIRAARAQRWLAAVDVLAARTELGQLELVERVERSLKEGR